MASLRIAAVMAVHNRRELTLACLDTLRAQELPATAALDVFVLDDASTDGTAEAIAQRHPDVRLLTGDGQLYWNGGMNAPWTRPWPATTTTTLDERRHHTRRQRRPHRTPAHEQQLRARSRGPSSGPEPPGTQRPANPPTVARTAWGPGVRCARRTLTQPGSQPRRCETMNGKHCFGSAAAAAKRVRTSTPPISSRWATWTTGCGRAPPAARSQSLHGLSANASPIRRGAC